MTIVKLSPGDIVSLMFRQPVIKNNISLVIRNDDEEEDRDEEKEDSKNRETR